MSEGNRVTGVDNSTPKVPALRTASFDALDITAADDCYFTSVDESTDEGKRRILVAFDEPTVATDEILGKPIQVTDLLCHHAQAVDRETGEVQFFVRTVLFLKSGDTIAFGAASIFNSFRRICRLWNKPPWPDGFTVVITSRRTPAKHMIYRVHVPEMGSKPESGKKGK